MEIKLNSASAHVEIEKDVIKIEADVNINGGQTLEIVNGHVTREDPEMEGHQIPVADFHDSYGTRNVTYFGALDIETQVATLTLVSDFCAEVRETRSALMAE